MKLMSSPVTWVAQVRWVLVALLLAWTRPAVAGIARCSYNNAHTLANCSGHGLNTVPWNLHKNINSLDLSSNSFPVLENQSFISYKFIAQLYLQNNSLNTVQAGAFQSLQYLRTLDLSNNRLVHVPREALDTVAYTLIQLVLAGNKIYSLPAGVFSKLHKLKHLDISGNRIYEVSFGAFRGLESLTALKLRHNTISHLPPDSFDDFPTDMNTVQLYDNNWICDCRIRWLREWLNATDRSVWDTPGYPVHCDGPSIVRDKLLGDLPYDELACEVEMKTSGSTRSLPKGGNTTLLCKYSSMPEAEAQWLRNSETIDPTRQSHKYSVESWAIEGAHGSKTQITELKIRNFQYDDIAKYVCFVQNIRGVGTTAYKLTLEGVDFKSVTFAPAAGQGGQLSGSGEADVLSIIIAVSVVFGIILIVVIGVLIFCTVNRMQKKKQEKRDAIVENVKQHFINDSELMSNGDTTMLNSTKLSNSKSMEDKLDHAHEDDRSTSNNTNDSVATAVKRPLDLDETEPLYIFEQPGSPFNNGNTYVSFGSELTDPSDFPPPQPPAAAYPRGSSSRYEGSSHAGSATPLLERYTPSVFDSDEPVEDYAHYPVYDSLTNSLHHPVSSTPTPMGAAAMVHQRDVVPRHASASSYNGYGHGNPPQRFSSFHYPSSTNGSLPHTPASTRSTQALAPNYADYNTVGGGVSPRPDLHRGSNAQDYRDYRDMRYPTVTPPPHRMTPATKKSMSVGNLGYAPLSSGPRKPPRVFQSREYMELTPQEAANEYITSPEAQQYSQSFGITPGTPV